MTQKEEGKASKNGKIKRPVRDPRDEENGKLLFSEVC